MTEEQVKDSVVAYLQSLLAKSKGFYTINSEQRVALGSMFGRADIVVWCGYPQRMLVIVECKASHKIDGEGIGQLYSYLCATDTPLGIVANSADTQRWTYFENLGRSVFQELKSSEFIEKLKSEEDWQEQIQLRITELVDVKIKSEVQKRVTPTLIHESTKYYIKEQAHKRITEDKIGKYVLSYLNKKVQTQTEQLSECVAELEKVRLEHFQERVRIQSLADKCFWWSFFGWAFLIGIVLLLLFL